MPGKNDTAVGDETGWIEALRLYQFRNYADLSLILDARHVVLSGENGVGKTNILEAVSFLSPGRGMRRVSYDRVALQGQGADGTWAVNARINTAGGTVSVGTGTSLGPAKPETQRRVHINQVTAKSADTLLEYSRIMWLTPAMDGLFTGPNADRRRFLDRMVLAVDPVHGRRVARFEKAMRSRNRLLEQGSSDESWLSGIEAQMAELGTAIASARLELVSLLSRMINESTQEDMPFPDAIIMQDGTLESYLADRAATDVEDLYLNELREFRAQDRTAGRTLRGPHRSNLLVRHRPKDMDAAFCSTGEQKALLVGLVLAHARLIGEITGTAPILLLDEITAHLDAGRRAALFDLVDSTGCQAWMTGTDKAMFQSLGDRAQFFDVASGTAVPAD